MIGDMKAEIDYAKLDLPPQWLDYISYCGSLGFEEKPDYSYLLTLIEGIALNYGFSLTDGVYDWGIF